ncbi:DUF4383 domain-containing protein [Amycolatopsis sp., V23-08]|uniref:DUF4383 domain-containing protein n=1 Tax=Amycolatopsis heterodermiae TaxID=3110235 RepID=A0ABU5RCK6_9PSEU|nr:DUF4383 domain-containing protein [Amycolatopsis sp., V23-08]MEA5363509.1 DUF4383 domain-containing protein [Amycolatopsis sp., V23-08]
MTHHTATAPEVARRPGLHTALQLVALVIGLGYLALGIGGFLVPGNADAAAGEGFGAPSPQSTLLIFTVGPVLNVLHTLGGLVGLAAARSVSGAALYGLAGSVGFAGLSAFSFLAVTVDIDDRPPFGWADVVLYVITTGVLVALAVLAFRAVRLASNPPAEESTSKL